MSNRPTVSIGLPVYNGANFLRASINSILAQEYSDWELIITDNASTDETEAICREYAARDSRVQYVRNETNIGASGNYNKCFDLARGTYFKWQAHDDECHPSMLGRCIEYLDAAPSHVTMVYPLGELIDGSGKTITPVLDHIESHDSRPHRRLARVLWDLNMCDPVFGMFRSDYLRRTQLIGPFFGADYVLLGELAMLGEIHELPEVLFRLRAHEKRSVKANAKKSDLAAWYDPKLGKKRLVLGNWDRMAWEMFKSAKGFPLPFGEKLKCCATVVAVHYWRRFKNAGGRWKQSIRQALGAQMRDKPATLAKGTSAKPVL
jgi:glycosyltransferase involved in cell wall biosynthesis